MGVKHENVTSNRARSRRGSHRAGFRRNREPDVWRGFGAGVGAGVVHKGVPTTAEADNHRPTSRSISRYGCQPVFSTGEAGWSSFEFFEKCRGKEPEMRRPMSNKIDDDSWVMGVLEPILFLLVIAIDAALVQLL